MPREVLRATDEEDPEGGVRVTNMELFFDLVYVFAITQLSDFLFDHQTPRGALEALLLFSAVWWAWNYTAWATNWMDPEGGPGTLVMIALMLLSLVMASAIPRAFTAHGGPFAISYALIGVLRTGFVAWAFPAGSRMRSNNLRLLSWLAIGGVIWVAGAYVDGDARIAIWAVAAVVDLLAPMHGFRLPGLGGTPIEAWQLTGTHLAERYQLVLMIALGESVLRVGLTWQETGHGSVPVDAAFVAGFLTSASMWAAYFVGAAERGAERVSRAGSAGARIGRSAYAYGHAVMVAGVIVVAVGVHIAIIHPDRIASAADAVILLGGPAVYLGGLALYKRAAQVSSPVWLLAGISVLVLLTLVAVLGVPRLALLACTTAVLLTLVVVARPLAERTAAPD